MKPDSVTEDTATRTAAGNHVQRPGPVAWLVILVGFGVMAWAVFGVFAESERTAPASWFTWLIGGALVHDLIVLPATGVPVRR